MYTALEIMHIKYIYYWKINAEKVIRFLSFLNLYYISSSFLIFNIFLIIIIIIS
jgi:hypothetical protein